MLLTYCRNTVRLPCGAMNMNAYKVLFTPKPEIDAGEVVSLALSYVELLKREKLINSYELNRAEEKGNFDEIWGT